MNKDQAILVHRLEESLSDIRKIAGWKGVELGNMLGLSRQAISTLEKGNSRLTFAQYIAIRHLLDEWMNKNPKNKILPRVINLVLDERRIFGKYYTDLLGIVSTISAISASNADPKVTENISMELLDKWEIPAREYCYKMLQNEMIQEQTGVTAETEVINWTEQIFDWRNNNGK